MPSTDISREKFVRAWAHASCIADVERITGLSRTWIKRRARALRRAGVKLPSFGQPKPFDAARLNRLFEKERREVLRAELAIVEGRKVTDESDSGVAEGK